MPKGVYIRTFRRRRGHTEETKAKLRLTYQQRVRDGLVRTVGRPLKAETNYANPRRMRLWLAKLAKAQTEAEKWEVILQAEGICVDSGLSRCVVYGLEDERLWHREPIA